MNEKQIQIHLQNLATSKISTSETLVSLISGAPQKDLDKMKFVFVRGGKVTFNLNSTQPLQTDTRTDPVNLFTYLCLDYLRHALNNENNDAIMDELEGAITHLLQKMKEEELEEEELEKKIPAGNFLNSPTSHTATPKDSKPLSPDFIALTATADSITGKMVVARFLEIQKRETK